jgi:predicted transcriptional regulator
VIKIIPEKKVIKNSKKNKCAVETKKIIKNEKIEICYFCHKKFDINKNDLSHYKYGEYPMCDYCSEFYGFYSD